MQNKTLTILKELEHSNLSANEIISCKANGYSYEMAQKIIKLQHLNKMPSLLEKQGLISCIGKNDCGDKIWNITSKGLDMLGEFNDDE